VFTQIILKLIPAPRKSVDLLCLFESTHEAISAVPRVMTETGIVPTAIEFMDREAVYESCQYLNESLPYEQAGAMLLITVDGSDAAQVEADYEAIGELCLSAGAIEVYVADNRTTSERIWKVRRNIAEAFALHSDLQANEDLVVPPAAIPGLVDGMGVIAEKYGVMMPSYGHAGDGNLHTRITPPAGWDDEKWLATVPDIQHELYELTAGLGGRLSGEHGIGHKRKDHVATFLTHETMEAMRTVKRAFDPNNILNPGKMFDV